MKLVNTSNGGSVVVAEDFGQRLIETGIWKPASKPTKPPKSKTPTKPKEE